MRTHRQTDTLTHAKINPGEFIPVPKWEQYHAWPSEAGLRYLIFNRKHNGFDRCVKRVWTTCADR